jgi:pimeloyl-ACP methyl ester carboxylesterase
MVEWNLESYRAEQSANQPIPPDVIAAEALDRLTMPVLALWGTFDVTSTLRSGEWLVANLPGIKSRVFEGVAHLRMWDEQVAALRDAYRIIRYDTRGFGKTRVDDVPYSNAKDLAAVMDYHGAQSAHVCGLSRGAQIALDFAVNEPDRTKSLTWVAGGVRGLEVPDDPRDVAAWEAIEPLIATKEWEKIAEMETALWTDGPDQPTTRVDPDVRRRMYQWDLESLRAEQSPEQVIKPEIEAANALDRLTMPVLAMWGTLDVTSTVKSGEWFVANLPGVRSRVFEGVAHMVNLERPTEFNELLREFLDDAEAAAGR